MKIGVVGCGALGSFYGAKLWKAGHDVHFLLRSDYDVVCERGVQIESADGSFIARPQAARTPQEIGVCDLVLIGLKNTANGEFPKLLPPLIGTDTLVLTLQNGLGNEEAGQREAFDVMFEVVDLVCMTLRFRDGLICGASGTIDLLLLVKIPDHEFICLT